MWLGCRQVQINEKLLVINLDTDLSVREEVVQWWSRLLKVGGLWLPWRWSVL